MEPITLAVGGALVLVGFVGGRITRPKTALAALTYDCTGCLHAFSMHDPKTGECNAAEKSALWSTSGKHLGYHPAPCACLNYTGDRPLDVDPSEIIRKINEG